MTGKPVNLLVRIKVRDGADPIAAADDLAGALGLEHTRPGRVGAIPLHLYQVPEPRPDSPVPRSARAALPGPSSHSSLLSYSAWRKRTGLEPPDGTDAELWRINGDTFYLYHSSGWSTIVPAEPIAAQVNVRFQEFFDRVLDFLGTLPVDVEVLLRARSGQPRTQQRTTIISTADPATKVRVVQHNADPTYTYLVIEHPVCGRFAQRAPVPPRDESNEDVRVLAIANIVTFAPHDRETARIIGELGDSFHDVADHYAHHGYPASARTWLATVAPTQGRPQDDPAAGLDPGSAGATVAETAARLGLDAEYLGAAVKARTVADLRDSNYDPWEYVVKRPSAQDWAWRPKSGPDRLDPHHIAFKYWLSTELDRPARDGSTKRGSPPDSPHPALTPIAEDAFELPEAWRAPLHPRRGGAATPADPPRTDANRLVAVALAKRAETAARVKGSDAADSGLVQALVRFESGLPDPVGAAVQAALVLLWQVESAQLAVAFADLWAARYGLPFAACAAVELNDVVIRALGGRSHPGSGGLELRRDEDQDLLGPQPFRSQGSRTVLRRVRELLAAGSDRDYADAVTRLAERRSRGWIGWPRIAASYLVPTQSEWVTECCTNQGRVVANSGEARLLLLASMSDPAQAVALARSPLNPRQYQDFPVALLHTLVDGMGPGGIPIVAGLLKNPDLPLGRAAERRAAEILAALPHDRAMAALVQMSHTVEFSPRLVGALRGYPVRGLRLLSDAAVEAEPAVGKAARRLLARHLAEFRETLVPLLTDLAATERDLALKLLAEHDLRLPESSWDELPGALREPPSAGPAAPDWLDTVVLPQILARGGTNALPQRAIAHLVRWVELGSQRQSAKMSADDRQSVESAVHSIREFCDPASLAGFFTALFEQVDTARHPDDHRWVLDGLGSFGDDASAERFAGWIRANLAKRPAEARRYGFHLTAEPLARMDSAYSRLCQESVWEWTGLGVPSGRLAHRLAADRREVCRLPEEAPASTCEVLSRTVAQRLERAMVSGRTWPLAEFIEDYGGNHQLRSICGAILWYAESEGQRVHFRVAEDGSFLDTADNPLKPRLPQNAAIGVAHRIRLSREEGTQWRERFRVPDLARAHDHSRSQAQNQPFDQLNRPIHRLGAEAADWRVQLAVGRRLHLGLINSLVRKGWTYGRPDKRDARTRQSIHRVLDDLHTVVFEVSPFAPDEPSSRRLTAGVLALAAPPRPGRAVAEPRPTRQFAQLDDMMLSELLHDFNDTFWF